MRGNQNTKKLCKNKNGILRGITTTINLFIKRVKIKRVKHTHRKRERERGKRIDTIF